MTATQRHVTASTPASATLSSETTRTVVVLDTSVLVADPDALHAFPGADVVVPLTVVEELDSLKSRTDEVGWLARTALRNLEALRRDGGGSLAGPVTTKTGGTVRVEVNGIQRHILTEHGLDPAKPDNRIIGAALGLGGSPRVISNDAAFRVKAAHLGLAADEHTPSGASQIGPGWVTLEVGQSELDALYAAKSHPRTNSPIELASAPQGNGFAVVRAGSGSALIRLRPDSVEVLDNNSPTAWGLRPRSKEQRFALELLLDPEVKVVALHGPAGTGKSLLAVAAGLELTVERDQFERLSIFRPLVPVGREDLGFLPGDVSEKVHPHFAAFYDSVTALTERRSVRDAEKVVQTLLTSGQLSLEPVTFLRGRSLAGSFIMVDESTNLERPVLKTLLTRVSEGTKIVFTGDVSQIDNPFASERNNALTALLEAFDGQECFGHVELTACERSEVSALAASLL